METGRWSKIEENFSGACALQGTAREDFLSSGCSGDRSLYTEVTALLREHETPSAGLDTSVFDVGLQVLDENSADKRAGSILGKYRFGKMIGRGGMGEIYAAEDQVLGRRVAIKLVNELFALDPERIRRFRKEADAASRVSHPNVARLFELCEIDGEHLIVMEFVDGVNLRSLMKTPMPPGRAVNIAVQVVSALVAAHSVGVVHRDIKPENIIILGDGTVKVLDFGLAKLVDPIGEGAIHIPGAGGGKLTVDMSTELGAIMGTPAYMSPEQIRGADVDTQTDIWSVGVLLYEMLSGQLPFRGRTKIDLIAGVLMSQHLPVEIDSKPLFEKLNAVLCNALAKTKADRYRNAEVLLADLRELGDEAGRRPFRLNPAWKYTTGIILMGALLIAALPESRRLVRSMLFAPPTETKRLVSYWTAEGNADDVIGDNDGSLVNQVAFAPGYVHQAFSLDGNGYIEVPDSLSLSITGPLTLAANIKLTTNTTQQAIIEKYEQPGINGYVLRIGSTGKIEASVCDQVSCGHFLKAVGGATTVSTGVWHKVAAVYDGTSIKIYLDGILDGTIPTEVVPTDGASNLKIGARGDDNNKRFGGLIDDVKIYNKALSATEISLVSYWPADGNANDVVGSNNGKLANGASYRPGVSGQAFSYDGIDDLMQAPANGLPTENSDRTLSMWVTIDDFLTPSSFFGGYGEAGNYGNVYYLTTVGGNYLGITNWGEGQAYFSMDRGRWYHIAATTDRNSTSLYVDAELVKTQTLILDTPADTEFFSGSLPGSFGKIHRLRGSVDEIMVFDRALSAAEIQNIFHAQTPPNAGLPSPVPPA